MIRPRRKPLGEGETSYSFAVLRVVPHVYTGAFVPVGVILHARTREFLGMRVINDREALAKIASDVDVDLLAKYLGSCEAICRGDETAGPVALAPPSERFHWLTSPRSDVIQCGPIHDGITTDPQADLDRLFEEMVTRS